MKTKLCRECKHFKRRNDHVCSEEGCYYSENLEYSSGVSFGPHKAGSKVVKNSTECPKDDFSILNENGDCVWFTPLDTPRISQLGNYESKHGNNYQLIYWDALHVAEAIFVPDKVGNGKTVCSVDISDPNEARIDLIKELKDFLNE